MTDERLGEGLFAVIAPRPGATFTVGEIIRHCRKHIDGLRIPRRVMFPEALPRTAPGKVQIAALW